ncbi:M1 family metallopeptidase [Methanorbis furvi]|uniref:Aminopeptidase N n=1 Tax=Methanorbis furvi TaxID=3028299 RepID=A0AAE4SBL4_9EURY|nr:Aminopeptidase N [Methanocorpusculaceae archaeon Ag1]
MSAAEYRYRPSEFPAPPVVVRHINLTFDIAETQTRVIAETTFTVLAETLDVLTLNAKNLEIRKVRINGKNARYLYEDDLLKIQLSHPSHRGAHLTLWTETICRPTSNILEGLYYDASPAGLPKTQITQCQQWGFQRIAPVIDDMRAKSTWTTTIIADSRYTNLISNGDIKSPRTSHDATRDIITYQNNYPMPPYLFFLGVGTWDTFTRSLEYPDGKKIRLELLAEKGADPAGARAALDILADSILWTCLFTGPERYESPDVRLELYRLCRTRDKIISENPGNPEAALAPIRRQISILASDLVFGYQYPYDVYREISMQNSDFGGMENTGNTTIIQSRIMPTPEITDASYEYMIGVKQHEFYHNLNGSSVTGDTPFSIWLNEAVTVMMEDDYLSFLFGSDYIRLQNILQIYTPGTGTFSLDTGAAAMPIEPEGFNDPNDLITSVTYVKAPEFVRMIQVMLGNRAFTWALDLYHRRFAGGNASPRDWFDAMENVSKIDFSTMAGRWLKQTGYPTITVSAAYNAEEEVAEIIVDQTGFGDQSPWIFPLVGTLITDKGVAVAEFVEKIDGAHHEFTVPCVGAFAAAIWNPGHAAYVRIANDASDSELYLLLKYDTDVVSRFLAYQTLVDREMARLCRDPDYVPDSRLVDWYVATLSDNNAMQSTGSLSLTIFESVNDPEFTHRYAVLYSAKKRFMRSVAAASEQRLLALYTAYNTAEKPTTAPADLARIFKTRAVKNLILSHLATLDTPEVWDLIKKSYEKSSNATSRIAALSLYLSSTAPDRFEVLTLELDRSKADPVAWENFLAAVAGTSSPDTVAYLRMIEKSENFHVEQAGQARSLYLRFANNRKLSLETEEGRAFLRDSLISLSRVNEYISTGILSVFSHLDSYDQPVRDACFAILSDLVATVSDTEAPAVIRTARRIIAGSPKAQEASTK